MKILEVSFNNRSRRFEVVTDEISYRFPFAGLRPRPAAGCQVVKAWPDADLGFEGFSYELSDVTAGTVHLDAVLEYNRDPRHVRDMLVYRLTVEALKRIEHCGLSRREIARRLNTSPTQLYRLLDPTHYRKSLDQMISLLTVLNCTVDITVAG